MKTHESIIEVDGVFTGTTSEAVEYLGYDSHVKSQFSKCANEGRKFRGHTVKLIGSLKHVMIYGVMDGEVLIDSGTAAKLAEKYNVITSHISHLVTTKNRLQGKYTIVKIGPSEVLEEI